MVILPFDVASRNRSSGLRLHLACLQCSPRELKRFAVDYRWSIYGFRQGDKFATLDRSEIGFVRMSLQGHEYLLPPPRLSARYRLSEGTFDGT